MLVLLVGRDRDRDRDRKRLHCDTIQYSLCFLRLYGRCDEVELGDLVDVLAHHQLLEAFLDGFRCHLWSTRTIGTKQNNGPRYNPDQSESNSTQPCSELTRDETRSRYTGTEDGMPHPPTFFLVRRVRVCARADLHRHSLSRRLLRPIQDLFLNLGWSMLSTS